MIGREEEVEVKSKMQRFYTSASATPTDAKVARFLQPNLKPLCYLRSQRPSKVFAYSNELATGTVLVAL